MNIKNEHLPLAVPGHTTIHDSNINNEWSVIFMKIRCDNLLNIASLTYTIGNA